MSFTPQQLIDQYIKLRDTVKAIELEQAEVLKPYKTGMDLIENMVTKMLLEGGLDAFKTEAGTAFKTTQTGVKLENRDAIIAFVLQDPSRFDIFTNSVSKDYVKAFIDANGAPPPGITLNQYMKIQFRKA